MHMQSNKVTPLPQSIYTKLTQNIKAKIIKLLGKNISVSFVTGFGNSFFDRTPKDKSRLSIFHPK